MDFVRRTTPDRRGFPYRLGILAGSFNPPTRAHMALLDAARPMVDEVLCVLPRVFPHKLYHGASLRDRVAMLELVSSESIAIVERGLFIDIARECRREYGGDSDLVFLCGRDAAERIVEWDYGEPGAIDRILDEFRLLVAARGGDYTAPPRLSHRIATYSIPVDCGDISSTEVRDRLQRGESVADLVPAPILDFVERLYR